MSKREAALKALDSLRNTDDTQESEEEEEYKTNHHIIDSIESKINRVNEDQNIGKTSKIGVIWTKLKNGEDLSKPAPTSYATRNKDNTKLSAFLMIFDISMLNLIVQCTNLNPKNYEDVSFTFIGVLIFRGCQFGTAGSLSWLTKMIRKLTNFILNHKDFRVHENS
ncbi:hypothetical protein BpHYR1_007307 [Brachionus plicatilis]|uniref:Uncharacterized protein n=1 Tax=Brachionus plicatilis TaxID=10195 RepID=A0A3M7RBN9_BRAPC|nr:hypothetical protein BpHYR1_007307 [Brachionus plicatilis]